MDAPVEPERAWAPSRRMQSAAQAEQQRLQRELDRLARRNETLAEETAQVNAQRRELTEQLSALSRFTASDRDAVRTSHLRAVGAGGEATGGTVLKGAQIRETAVRVLAASGNPSQAVHYREWYELFRRQGFLPAGKDPLATFLTQIGRSPVVRRTTSAGTYQLDFEFPNRTRRRLTQLRQRLRETHDVAADADITVLAEARQLRSHLTTEVAGVERNLEEALRSLGAA